MKRCFLFLLLMPLLGNSNALVNNLIGFGVSEPFVISEETLPVEQLSLPAVISAIKSIYPNPFTPATTITITIELSKASNVQMDIYNLKGELIRQLDSSAKNAGTHSLLWNGLSDSGQTCGSGIYLLRLTVEGKSSQAKFTLIK